MFQPTKNYQQCDLYFLFRCIFDDTLKKMFDDTSYKGPSNMHSKLDSNKRETGMFQQNASQ